jgi:hypothetical protein
MNAQAPIEIELMNHQKQHDTKIEIAIEIAPELFDAPTWGNRRPQSVARRSYTSSSRNDFEQESRPAGNVPLFPAHTKRDGIPRISPR